MKKSQSQRIFPKRLLWKISCKTESLCEFTLKVLHNHCFLNDLVKLFRTAFTDCVSLFATGKNDYKAEKTN